MKEQIEKSEYLKRLLDTPLDKLEPEQKVLVERIKHQQKRIELYQLRLLKMIDETQIIQRNMTQCKGAMSELFDMLWEEHNASLDKFKNKPKKTKKTK